MRLHNNDVYLDDVLFRAVELTKLAVWFSDKGLLGKAEQMIMMAHNLGPQKLWDEKHSTKILNAQKVVRWIATRCSTDICTS